MGNREAMEDMDYWADWDEDDAYDESLDACPACDTLPSKCYGGCCKDCNHANSWHAGMTTGSTGQAP